MLFRQLFDQESGTYTYLIADKETLEAVLARLKQKKSKNSLRF